MDDSYVQVPLGGTLFMGMLSKNTSDVPTAPDAAPTFQILDASGFTATGTATAVSGQTGAYTISVAVTAVAGYQSGKLYVVIFSYALTASARKQVKHFLVT